MFYKTDVLTTIDTIVSKRLFGHGSWLVDGKPTASMLTRTLEELGLMETLSDGITCRCTRIGKEIDIELQSVFMGLCEVDDAIRILEDRNLLATNEGDALFELWEKHERQFEPWLRSRVQQAYRDYHNVRLVH
jgi:hypothetical protein